MKPQNVKCNEINNCIKLLCTFEVVCMIMFNLGLTIFTYVMSMKILQHVMLLLKLSVSCMQRRLETKGSSGLGVISWLTCLLSQTASQSTVYQIPRSIAGPYNLTDNLNNRLQLEFHN